MRAASRPSHPASHVRDDGDTPLSAEAERGDHRPDSHFWKSEIFFIEGLDTNSENQLVGQISPARRGNASNQFRSISSEFRMLGDLVGIGLKGKLKLLKIYGISVMATLLLRIAAAISLLFAVGHTLGGTKKWSPMGENEVLKAMETVRFDAAGANRSYFDFFMGFGWSISVFLLLQSALLWQIGSLARSNPTQVRPMIAMFGLAALASGLIAWRFILPLPALFSAVLLVVLVAAFIVAA